MAVGGTGSLGRFEIVRKSTYASYAEVYRKNLKQQQATAFANAANVMFGAITSESAGLFQVAINQATDRAKDQTDSHGRRHHGVTADRFASNLIEF